MEKRSLTAISIIIIVIGVIIICYGVYLVWLSFNMAEGGLVRAPSVIALFFGIVLFVSGIIGLNKARRR